MLRKSTSFSDPSLTHLSQDRASYNSLRRARHAVEDLVEDLALASSHQLFGVGNRCLQEIARRLMECFKDREGSYSNSFFAQLAEEFDNLERCVYRMETCMYYVFQNVPQGNSVKLVMEISFFRKTKKLPFFRIILVALEPSERYTITCEAGLFEM